MEKQTITFRADPRKVKALDRLARSLDRDRSYLLNEAVEQYLSVHEYHLDQIKRGLAEARAGKLLDYDEVKAVWRKRLGE
jgi:predicted transcriptional regulator